MWHIIVQQKDVNKNGETEFNGFKICINHAFPSSALERPSLKACWNRSISGQKSEGTLTAYSLVLSLVR